MIILWLVFGLIVGLLAKLIHPGEEPVGCLPTIAIGIIGSFVGGILNWLAHGGNHIFHPAGFLGSILGGILTCAAWRYYTLKNSTTGPKNFFSGKNLRS
jgi:uncharacterized membrane protein YeaQ/YmgE (transglycosylase-associated protein family)